MLAPPLLLICLTGAAADDVNRYLYPAETRLVAVFDLQSARKSEYFRDRIDDGFQRLIDSNAQIQKLSELLEFDPSQQIERFTVCGGGRQRDRSFLVIINGNFPYEKFTKVLAEFADAGELSVLEVNELPVYFNHRSRQASYFAVVDPKTIIASPSKPWLEDAVQGLTDLREPPVELATQIAWLEVGPTPVVNLGGLLPEEARQRIARVPQLAGIAEDLRAYNFVSYLADSPQLRLRLTMSDAESADQAATAFQTLLGLGRALLTDPAQADFLVILDALKIDVKERHILLDVTIPKEIFVRLLEQDQQRRDEWRRRREERLRNEPQPPA